MIPNIDSKSRRVKKWAVKYSETVECEYGYKHEVGNVLVGLASKSEAQKEAKELHGTVTQEYYWPKITDEEIKQLNDEGIPVKRTPYGLGFDGRAVAFSDSPNSLDDVRSLYRATTAPTKEKS